MVTQPDMAVAIEQAEVLQGLMAQADAAGYRDQSLPEGTLLGETELQGQQVKWRKPKSMVRTGNTPLPERFAAFDKFGHVSMLPTAQMGRMLSKPRADSPGERAFHTHTGGVTTETCKICPDKMPAAIDATCDFCVDRTVGKRFYREADLFAHQTRLHPDELMAFDRAIEREQRRGELESQQALASAMLEVARLNGAQATHEAQPAPKARA